MEIPGISLSKTFSKGEILLYKGDYTNHIYYVKLGCLKSYVIDARGKEHILQFAPENWYISDMNSLLNKEPSIVFIEAIEDTEVYLIPYAEIEVLEKQNSPDGMRAQNLLLVRNIISLNKRLTMLLASTAEERYLDFIETYPNLNQRLKLKLIASYLRITPEYLSEIRRKLAGK